VVGVLPVVGVITNHYLISTQRRGGILAEAAERVHCMLCGYFLAFACLPVVGVFTNRYFAWD